MKIVAITFSDGRSSETVRVSADIGDDTHPEIRVHSDAVKQQKDASADIKIEEWEQAEAIKDEEKKSYWYNNATRESTWKQPLMYYPVKFKDRPKVANQRYATASPS